LSNNIFFDCPDATISKVAEKYSEETVLEKPIWYRELSPAPDITGSCIIYAQSAGIHLFTFDFQKVYDDIWKDVPENKPIAIALNPDTTGNEISTVPKSPLYPGFLLTPPSTNSIGTQHTRSILLENNRLIKGVGRYTITPSGTPESSQFTSRSGQTYPPPMHWMEGTRQVQNAEVDGGFRTDRARHEYFSGLTISHLFHQVFGEYPKIRLPRRTLDISQALAAEREFPTKELCQTEYKIETPVRSSYCYYLSDLAMFWEQLDLESEEGKTDATKMLNDLLGAYASKYFSIEEINSLSFEEVRSSGIFEAISTYKSVFESEESVEIEDPRPARRKMHELGYSLAEKFYQKNSKMIDETVDNEVKHMAELTGFCYAFGMDIQESTDSKDAYGGEISDLDSSYIFPKWKNKPIESSDILRVIVSLNWFTSLQGMDTEAQKGVINKYLKYCSEAFAKTYSFTNKLEGVTDTYKGMLHFYQNSLIMELAKPSKPDANDELMRYILAQNPSLKPQIKSESTLKAEIRADRRYVPENIATQEDDITFSIDYFG